jgi:hypothetical protein
VAELDVYVAEVEADIAVLKALLADDEAPDRKDLRTLARELVPGFLDRLAQRGVAGQRLAADPDRARRHVHLDLAYPRQLADLAPNGRGTVLAAHPRHYDGTRLHADDPIRYGAAQAPPPPPTWLRP